MSTHINFKNTLLAAFGLLAFTACDQVDDDERYIGPVDLPTNWEKNVLIEDFTGQECLNCPNAAEQIASIKQALGEEHVVAVAIHGGQLSMQTAPPYGTGTRFGLATTTGMDYHAHWGATTWPIGMVDRSGGLTEYASWTNAVITRLVQTPPVSISMSGNAYDAAARKLSIRVDLAARTEAVEGKLQVWLVENGFVGMQRMPDGSMSVTYEHNHVFRASVNDPYGDDVSLSAEGSLSKEYEISLEEIWKPENMAVVAFVYNDADGVMQVIEQPVAAEENNEQ